MGRDGQGSPCCRRCFGGEPVPDRDEEPDWVKAGFDSEDQALHSCLWYAADRILSSGETPAGGWTSEGLAGLLSFTAPSPN